MPDAYAERLRGSGLHQERLMAYDLGYSIGMTGGVIDDEDDSRLDQLARLMEVKFRTEFSLSECRLSVGSWLLKGIADAQSESRRREAELKEGVVTR